MKKEAKNNSDDKTRGLLVGVAYQCLLELGFECNLKGTRLKKDAYIHQMKKKKKKSANK